MPGEVLFSTVAVTGSGHIPPRCTVATLARRS
jgi:hypothetical protein